MIRLFLAFSLLLFTFPAQAAEKITAAPVQTRMSQDVAAGKPLVAHVIVALCDNKYQGIVPVPAHLGDGDDPRSNLYWGAMFGLRTYFSRMDGWSEVEITGPQDEAVLDRVAFKATLKRDGKSVDAIVIAEAWRGRQIKAATARFLTLSGGESAEKYIIGSSEDKHEIEAGGASHLIAYIGHNGLMDFAPPPVSEPQANAAPRSSMILACYSRNYFAELLLIRQAHILLTTNGFMAPEAYTLEAAVSSWFSGGSSEETRNAAGDSYAKFQKANRKWSRKLFAADP